MQSSQACCPGDAHIPRASYAVASFSLRDEFPLSNQIVCHVITCNELVILHNQVCEVTFVQVLAMFAGYQQEFSIFDNYQLTIESMASGTIDDHDMFDTIRLDRG